MTGGRPVATAAAIKLPYPHAGQRTVLEQARRHNRLAAGRRWRKTTLFMSIAVENALRGLTVIWGAPTYDQTRVGFNEMRKAAGGVADFNISRMTVTFPGGGMVLFRSMDKPDNVRGHTADVVIIDEAGDVSPVAWDEALRPMLIDTNGQSWIGGTPKGRNWFWQEFVEALDAPDSMAWQAPTLGCAITEHGLVRAPHPMENPDIPFSEMVRLYETTPERTFRQEILAEFVEGEGTVFRKVRDAATLTATGPGWPKEAREPRDNEDTVMGVDWARSHDFTVLAVIDRRSHALVALDRFNGVGWQLQRDRLANLAARWQVKQIWAEANSIGGPNIEALQAEGLPVYAFTTTATSKPPLIESLVLAFERGEIRILDDPILLAELEAYESVTSPVTGRTHYSAPAGMHDDTVIALALAWHAAQQRPARIQFAPNPFFGG